MNNNSNSKIIYFFILLQIILSFILGIFGNKIADGISLAPGYLLAGTVALLIILFAISILLLNNDHNNKQVAQKQSNSAKPQLNSLARLFLSRVISIFPFGVAVGSLSASVLVSSMVPYAINMIFVFSGRYYGKNSLELPGPKNYEIVCFIFLIVSLFLVYAYKSKIILSIAYAIGFALGTASVIMFLDPYYNWLIPTFLGWCIAAMIAAFIVRYQGIRDFIRKIAGALIEEQ